MKTLSWFAFLLISPLAAQAADSGNWLKELANPQQNRREVTFEFSCGDLMDAPYGKHKAVAEVTAGTSSNLAFLSSNDAHVPLSSRALTTFEVEGKSFVLVDVQYMDRGFGSSVNERSARMIVHIDEAEEEIVFRRGDKKANENGTLESCTLCEYVPDLTLLQADLLRHPDSVALGRPYIKAMSGFPIDMEQRGNWVDVS
ncbi:MAG: hypothetical protein AAF202_08945, partial [Pseudomonadota bacterium]